LYDNFNKPRKQKRNKAKNQNLGLLYKFNPKNLFRDGFFGERSRDCKEEEDKELIICDGTEM
jgi:hypothetical protein